MKGDSTWGTAVVKCNARSFDLKLLEIYIYIYICIYICLSVINGNSYYVSCELWAMIFDSFELQLFQRNVATHRMLWWMHEVCIAETLVEINSLNIACLNMVLPRHKLVLMKLWSPYNKIFRWSGQVHGQYDNSILRMHTKRAAPS